MTVGECLLENASLGSACQVGIQNYQVIEFSAQFLQGVTVAITGCNLNHICHNYASNSASLAFSSVMACAYSASLGALPCQPASFSIKLTPLPLVVDMTMAQG